MIGTLSMNERKRRSLPASAWLARLLSVTLRPTPR